MSITFSQQQQAAAAAASKQAVKTSLRLHRGSKRASKWLNTTEEQTRITTTTFGGLSRLVRSLADLVSKNGPFGVLLRNIILKTQDDRRCVKWAFAMRAVVLPYKLGHQMNAAR